MGWPRAVVFDLDGTLIDSGPDLARLLNKVLAEHGRSAVDPIRVRGFVGDGVAKLVERGFAATGSADIDTCRIATSRFLDCYEAEPAALTLPYPGVVATLTRLRDEGRRLAVCTNKAERVTHAVLRVLGLDGFFDAVIGGDTLAARKPDPAPLRAAIERLGVGPDEAIMVGDNEHDAATARAAGIPCVLVTYGYARAPLASLAAAATIDSFEDLGAALARLAAARRIDVDGRAPGTYTDGGTPGSGA
ncbi:MAG: phosphoglycolate phosphatase [Alphaproteobacteria bacterium]|nr:phosphoglycolate phosphatase [Alphaproteobacteria bacterium]